MEKLRFTVDSALLSELGERLVEHVHIALGELIKNGYDADATTVNVVLLGCSKEDEECIIEVSDDGVGMTFEDVKKYWMRIATTNKLKNKESVIYGRPRTGAKGIGRFSCRRLGTRLELETTAKKGKQFETTNVVFDWLDYKAGTEVTEIECDGERSKQKQGKCGTKLTIYGGKSKEWNLKSWNVVKRQMMSLIANRGARRRGFKEDPGFNIRLTAPDFEEEEITNPREQLMNAGWGRLAIEVQSEGKVVCQLEAKKLGKKQITHKDLFPGLAGTTASIAIVPDDRSQFRNTSVLTLKNLREILSEWGGVYVRHKGARVYPFGEKGNDWLNIDRDRARRLGLTEQEGLVAFAQKLKGVESGRALLNMLSSHSHIGAVEVCSPNEGMFQLKANREGFVGDRGVNRLRDILRFGIDWATIYRDYYVRLTKEEEAESTRKELEEVLKAPIESGRDVEVAMEYMKRELPLIRKAVPKSEMRKIQAVTAASKVIAAKITTYGEELRHLRLIASASTLVLVFAHEVKSLLGKLGEHTVHLGLIAKEIGGQVAEDVNEMREGLQATKERFTDLLGMTAILSQDTKKTKPAKLALKRRVERAIACYNLIIHNYEIDIDCTRIPNALQTGKMLEAELYSVLLNVLSNAIKSVIAGGRERRIQITAKKAAEGTLIHVMDTGIGLDPHEGEDLFVAFVADPTGKMYRGLERRLNPEDFAIVGTGSGLGLSIVREIVTARNGSIRFCKPKGKWKADLEILLP